MRCAPEESGFLADREAIRRLADLRASAEGDLAQLVESSGRSGDEYHVALGRFGGIVSALEALGLLSLDPEHERRVKV